MPSRMEQKESIELKRHSTQEKNKLKLKKKHNLSLYCKTTNSTKQKKKLLK